MLRDIRDALAGVGPRILCYPAGHGIGKSKLCAWVMIFVAACYRRALAISTAPTWTQVEEVLWKEINWVWAQAGMPGECLQTKFSLPNFSEGWGRSTNEPQKFQGPHAPVLVIVLDECPAILPGVIETILKGIAVSENYLVVAPGNPIEPGGPFHDLCKSHRSKTRYGSCLDHPNVIHRKDLIPGAVTYRACLEMVEDYCDEIDDPEEIEVLAEYRKEMLDGKTPNGKPYNPWAHAVEDPLGNLKALYWSPSDWDGPNWFKPSPIVQSRLLGRFPDQGDDILIPIRWCEEAMRRGEDVLDRLSKMKAGKLSPSDVPEFKSSDPCVVAADVARHGDNCSVFMARRGRVVFPAEEHTQLMTNITAMRFTEYYRRHGASFGAIDVGAFGWGVHDSIVSKQENGDISLFPVDFGSSPGVKHSKIQFFDKRAQMYWGVRCLLEKGKIDLPYDETLRDQLCSIRYFFNLRGQLQIESKKDMKKRGIKSPDRADTLAMLCDEAIDGAWGDETDDLSWITERYERPEVDPYAMQAALSIPGAKLEQGLLLDVSTMAQAVREGIWD